MSSSRETKVGEELTALDGIGAAIASLGAVFCLQLPFFLGPVFQKMFADFADEPPAITRLVLTLWFPVLLGLIPAFMVALVLVRRTSLGVRRGLIVGALFLSLSSSGLCLYALYGQPMSLVGRIK